METDKTLEISLVLVSLIITPELFGLKDGHKRALLDTNTAFGALVYVDLGKLFRVPLYSLELAGLFEANAAFSA